MGHRFRRVGALSAIAVGAVASPATATSPPTSPAGELQTEVIVEGLAGPTQIVRDGEYLIVAELDGAENDATGRILRISLAAPDERAVLYDGLRKPTGVAVVGDRLWVMEQRTLSVGPIDGGGELQPVVDELPFNGRSSGTLTATEDGDILYNTSGTLLEGTAAPGSATLWSIREGGAPEAVATGFKNAYGRVIDDAGTLWQAEMSDGSYDGAAAPDELVTVEPGDDFGWPRCIGDGVPVAQYGGTAESCAATPPSFTLFEPGATPTSVAMAPWNSDLVVVALWTEGRVVTVDRRDPQRPATIDELAVEVANPQYLLADGDRLLVVDFAAGEVLAISPDP